MRYLALAADYDGTLATDSIVGPSTLEALHKLRASGRKLILVTGRELPDLFTCFGEAELFDWIVAENGGLLYRPSDRTERALASPPPEKLVQALERRGVSPLSLGRVILATWRPHETAALAAIRDQGLEYQVIFNKGAVMLLPAGVNKSTGLHAALAEMGVSPHNVVGVGDAENDHAFLSGCECSVAVANAIRSLQDAVDWVAPDDHGPGVEALIERIIDNDLAELEPRLARHHILLGTRDSGEEVRIRPYGMNLLIAGDSGSGKSTLAMALIERLIEQRYQVCVIDPEGDHGNLKNTVNVGGPQQPPTVEQVNKLLSERDTNVVVNLLALKFDERPRFFLALNERLREMRAARCLPHWLLIDEAHHVLPVDWRPDLPEPPGNYQQTAFITMDPATIERHALESIDTLVAAGESSRQGVQKFCEARRLSLPQLPSKPPDRGGALFWRIDDPRGPCLMRVVPGVTEQRRHRHKYAEGDLGKDRSFYFRGVEEKLNLQAQNLMMFLQLAEGVDDETWLYHLRRGDYSGWFRVGIKDENLAKLAAEVEQQPDISARESRSKIREIIAREYTLPAAS